MARNCVFSSKTFKYLCGPWVMSVYEHTSVPGLAPREERKAVGDPKLGGIGPGEDGELLQDQEEYAPPNKGRRTVGEEGARGAAV